MDLLFMMSVRTSFKRRKWFAFSLLGSLRFENFWLEQMVTAGNGIDSTGVILSLKLTITGRSCHCIQIFWMANKHRANDNANEIIHQSLELNFFQFYIELFSSIRFTWKRILEIKIWNLFWWKMILNRTKRTFHYNDAFDR